MISVFHDGPRYMIFSVSHLLRQRKVGSPKEWTQILSHPSIYQLRLHCQPSPASDGYQLSSFLWIFPLFLSRSLSLSGFLLAIYACSCVDVRELCHASSRWICMYYGFTFKKSKFCVCFLYLQRTQLRTHKIIRGFILCSVPIYTVATVAVEMGECCSTFQ